MNESSNIIALLRPNIRALQPYASARDEAPESSGASSRIMLDANENSFGSPTTDNYSRYPDPQQRSLKAAFTALKSLSPEHIFLGNGSDEAIDLLIRAFVEPHRDNIILMPPTYGMYAVQANIHGAEIRRAPLLPDFSPNPLAVREATDNHTKLLFLCSPNNPTGQRLPEQFILEILDWFPGIVVLDEAYIDFSTQGSWTARLQQFPQLVVLQTLSKAWGLAGLRIGAAFAGPEIIQTLNKIKYPYNINDASIQLAEAALRQPEYLRETVQLIVAERRRLSDRLQRIPGVVRVFPSDANFLLTRVQDANGMYRYLAENGIIIRNRSGEMHCDNCLRITVGTPQENDRLLEVMAQWPGTPSIKI